MKHKCGRKCLPTELKVDKPQSVRLTPEAQCALKYLRTCVDTKFNLSATVSAVIVHLACSQGFRNSDRYAEFQAQTQLAKTVLEREGLAEDEGSEPCDGESGLPK